MQASPERCSVHPLFETVEEFPDPIHLQNIAGTIPEWLSGCIVRVGPGKFHYGKHEMKHWFDGHGIVHRFNLSGGKVSFQSRFVESDAYINNTAAQRLTVFEFGTLPTPDPCASYFSQFKSMFFAGNSDNANVNVFKRGDQILVLNDAPVVQVMDRDLDTVCKQDVNKLLSIHMTTSHPHIDPDGSIYNLASSFLLKPVHNIIKIPPPKEGEKPDELLSRTEIIASIPSKRLLTPSYSHSFGMSENYFIYCESAVTVNMMKILKHQVGMIPINQAVEYDPDEIAVLHVVNQSSGAISPVKYHVKGLFFFHTINCYEDDGHIVFDFIGYDDFRLDGLLTSQLEDMRSGKWISPDEDRCMLEPCPMRVVLPLNVPTGVKQSENLVRLHHTTASACLIDTNTVWIEGENLLPKGKDFIEMPQINYEKVNGRPYRYFYGTSMFSNQYFLNTLGKVDVKMKTSIRWKGSVDQYPSEVVFVPTPGATEEDDGIVMSTVCDTDPDKSDFLLILDAKTFQEIGRAYVPPVVTIPLSLHGSFYQN